MLRAGDVTIHFLNDGFWWDDGGVQFGIVPRELWEKEKPANARNRIRLSLTCPLILTGREIILVDTGIGNRLNPRETAIYTPERSGGIISGLRTLGLEPEDVTHVILSHLHFDHVGGVLDKKESGAVRPVFSRARHFIQKADWELAVTPTDERLAAAYRHAPECLEPLKEIKWIDGDTAITPQVRTTVSGGHTAFHQCLIVESGGTGLIHLADVVPTVSHLRPTWNAAYDTDPLKTIAAKKRLLAEARQKNLWISFSHDDKVAAGRLGTGEEKNRQLEEAIPISRQK